MSNFSVNYAMEAGPVATALMRVTGFLCTEQLTDPMQDAERLSCLRSFESDSAFPLQTRAVNLCSFIAPAMLGVA